MYVPQMLSTHINNKSMVYIQQQKTSEEILIKYMYVFTHEHNNNLTLVQLIFPVAT